MGLPAGFRAEASQLTRKLSFNRFPRDFDCLALDFVANCLLRTFRVSAATPLRLFGAPAVPPQMPVRADFETADCPLCGGCEHETVLFAEDPLTPLSGRFRIVRCRRCQMAFTSPRPTADSLGLFYPPNYAPHVGREAGANSRGRLLRKLEIAHLRCRYGYPPQPAGAMTALASALARIVIRRTRARERWVPFRGPGRLLDFGCGAGDFLHKMREYGWNVEGLDLSPRIVDTLRQKGVFRAHLGSLPHPDIPAASVDAITMWQSLEHVPDPKSVLRAAADALRPRGVLAVSVPNFGSWSFRQFQESWFGLALPRHLSHFTPQTLCHMVQAAGFRILLIEQVGRDGWIRKSAQRAAQHGKASRRFRLFRRKGAAGLVARWTELTGQADTVRLIAEKA